LLLANHGQGTLNFLVVKSCGKNREYRARTPEPAKGKYLVFNPNVWENAVGTMQVDEDEDQDEDEEEEGEDS